MSPASGMPYCITTYSMKIWYNVVRTQCIGAYTDTIYNKTSTKITTWNTFYPPCFGADIDNTPDVQ